MKLNNNDDSHNSGLNLLIYNMLLDIESHPAWVCGLKPKAEPVLATTENKLIEEKEKAVVVNDALTTERLAYWKQRRYLSLPIDSMVITSHYGKRKDPFTGKVANHRGIDLKGNNDYVYSIMPGMVVKQEK